MLNGLPECDKTEQDDGSKHQILKILYRVGWANVLGLFKGFLEVTLKKIQTFSITLEREKIFPQNLQYFLYKELQEMLR